MLPPKNDPRWKDLLSGKIKHEFKLFAAGMCISRLGREVKADPSKLFPAVDEAFAFFTKFEGVASEDIKAIFG